MTYDAERHVSNPEKVDLGRARRRGERGREGRTERRRRTTKRHSI